MPLDLKGAVEEIRATGATLNDASPLLEAYAKLEAFARSCIHLDSDEEGGEADLAQCIDDLAIDARRALGLCAACGLRDATPGSDDGMCSECACCEPTTEGDSE